MCTAWFPNYSHRPLSDKDKSQVSFLEASNALGSIWNVSALNATKCLSPFLTTIGQCWAEHLFIKLWSKPKNIITYKSPRPVHQVARKIIEDIQHSKSFHTFPFLLDTLIGFISNGLTWLFLFLKLYYDLMFLISRTFKYLFKYFHFLIYMLPVPCVALPGHMRCALQPCGAIVGRTTGFLAEARWDPLVTESKSWPFSKQNSSCWEWLRSGWHQHDLSLLNQP